MAPIKRYLANRRQHLPLAVQLRACQVLAAMLAAGFSLHQSVTYLNISLAEYSASWQHLAASLAAGEPLDQGLRDLGFAASIQTQVQLANTHGQLADSFTVASDFIAFGQRNRKRLRALLLYPLLLMGLLVLLQFVIIFWVMPTIALKQAHQVPWVFVAGGVTLGLALVIWVVRRRLSPLQRYRLSQWLPGVRTLVRLNYQYHFVSGAAQFLRVGEDITAYCSQLTAVDDVVLRGLGESVLTRLAAGDDLLAALNHPLIYEPARELVSLGQTQPFVQAGMVLFAEQLFQTLTAKSERLLAMVQPVLFLAIGLQIVLVYLDILLPLYGGIGGM